MISYKKLKLSLQIVLNILYLNFVTHKNIQIYYTIFVRED